MKAKLDRENVFRTILLVFVSLSLVSYYSIGIGIVQIVSLVALFAIKSF